MERCFLRNQCSRSSCANMEAIIRTKNNSKNFGSSNMSQTSSVSVFRWVTFQPLTATNFQSFEQTNFSITVLSIISSTITTGSRRDC